MHYIGQKTESLITYSVDLTMGKQAYLYIAGGRQPFGRELCNIYQNYKSKNIFTLQLHF